MTASDDAILRALQRLDEVEALSGIGSWEWDIAEDRLHWSAQLRRIYGMEDGGRELGYDDFIGRVHPDDREAVEAVVQRALVEGGTFEMDHRIVLDDDAVRHVHSRGHVVAGPDGRAGRMHGSAQDITDALAAEAERAAEARRVAEGQARDEALSLLAHDLRSPLSVVVGYVQLLARQARDGTVDPERLVAYGARIEESARQMTTLLEDLLADADPDSVGEPLDTEPIDLADLVRRVCGHHAGVVSEARIEARVPHGPLILDANEAKLERALHNLVLNAIKYSPEGAEVTVRVEATPDEVTIGVADHGIGIPQADLARIFERFMRGSNVSGRVSGIGLGLSSAKRAVEAHGGTIDVESTEGEGTTFTIRLPRTR